MILMSTVHCHYEGHNLIVLKSVVLLLNFLVVYVTVFTDLPYTALMKNILLIELFT